MKLSPVKKTVFTAVCMALCVVVPMAFHSVANAGSIFLPMHIPVLICGLVCGWPYGLLCGMFGPLLSSFTGMPPLAVLPGMMVECAVYGATAGACMQFIRTKRLYPDLYISLVIAMLAGRVISGIAKAAVLAPGTTLAGWATASFVTAFPGIVIQLVLIPTLVFALTKARLIPQKYTKQGA